MIYLFSFFLSQEVEQVFHLFFFHYTSSVVGCFPRTVGILFFFCCCYYYLASIWCLYNPRV